MPLSENFAAFLNKKYLKLRGRPLVRGCWRNSEHIPTVHQLIVCDNARCGCLANPRAASRENLAFDWRRETQRLPIMMLGCRSQSILSFALVFY